MSLPSRDRCGSAGERPLWFVAILLSAIWIFASVGWAQHEHKTAPGSVPSIGHPAVPFEVTSLEGKPLSLAALRGRPLIINFFASWCDPCREEMPLINQLAQRGAKEGYSVIGIAVEDSRSAVAQYVGEAKLVFPVALDLNSKVKRSYRIFGPPATFFIDREGVLRDVVIGPLSVERSRAALGRIKAGLP